jgi:tetratricopeptide (TPR) repeat protein
LNNRSFGIRAIVLAAISLPVVPVFMDYFGPETSARWMLAKAANEFDRGNVEEAQKLLEGAYAKSNEIVTDRDFWRQFERIELSDEAGTEELSPTKLWDEMIRRIDNPSVRANAAFEISTILSNRRQFQAAVNLLNEHLPPVADRKPVQNNQIAYMRSLTGSDLELALDEVERALKSLQNESFLDTKAWVLHGLGRNEEALEVIDEALKEMESTWRSNTKLDKYLTRMQEIEKSIEERAAAAKAKQEQEQEQEASQVSGQEGSDEKQGSGGFRVSSTSGAYLLNSEFPEVERAMPTILDVLATMRYHRMRICEALKKDDEAAREGRWLKEFSTKGLSEHF